MTNLDLFSFQVHIKSMRASNTYWTINNAILVELPDCAEVYNLYASIRLLSSLAVNSALPPECSTGLSKHVC